MDGKDKIDWGTRIAISAAIALILLLIVEVSSGGLLGRFILVAVGFAWMLALLLIAWRAMRAHERVADALERLAQGQEKSL